MQHPKPKNPNLDKLISAMKLQVKGLTSEALALMEDVEPVQGEEAATVIRRLLDSPRQTELLDLLVNSAIVGMTDNRVAL
jgi:hypothetical protein